MSRPVRSLLTVVTLTLSVGCGGLQPEQAAQGVDCDFTVSEPSEAGPALGRVKPGEIVCFAGDRLADLSLRMRLSGTAGEPISLVSAGAVVRSIDVDADYVTVDGFTVADGDGVTVEGTGLVLRNNVLRNAADDGIDCGYCRDSLLESNTVTGTDGTGIVVDGDRIEVRNNTISGSVMKEEGDADGIRFYGTGLRLTGNIIRDIKASGYPADDAPHTDCFQTYEVEGRPTYDVVISGNLCQNVDVHCLIATGKDFPAVDIPPGSTAITFENNNCTVYGSQAVLLQDFPEVVVRGNTFAGPIYRAIILTQGSVNGTVVGNIVFGSIPVVEIDDSSEPGFRAEGNVNR